MTVPRQLVRDCSGSTSSDSTSSGSTSSGSTAAAAQQAPGPPSCHPGPGTGGERTPWSWSSRTTSCCSTGETHTCGCSEEAARDVCAGLTMALIVSVTAHTYPASFPSSPPSSPLTWTRGSTWHPRWRPCTAHTPQHQAKKAPALRTSQAGQLEDGRGGGKEGRGGGLRDNPSCNPYAHAIAVVCHGAEPATRGHTLGIIRLAAKDKHGKGAYVKKWGATGR